MRADRLLSILALLQVHRRVTSSELARRLEVSQRTIHRDMEALSVMGVPVYAQRGAGGGWVLDEPYRTDLTGLNEDEIRTLFLAQSPTLLADLGLNVALEAALAKLLAALPSTRRRDAEFMRQRIHVDAAGWEARKEAIPALSALQDALWQERRVHLAYERADGATVERLVDPLGLVLKSNVWYLIASFEDEPLTYRVSRIRRAEIVDEPSSRPEDFDLPGCWERLSAGFKASLPRYPTRLRVSPDIADRVRRGVRFAKVEGEEEPEGDGRIVFCVRFEVEWEACEWVLSLAPNVEVLEPPALRERVVRAARGVIALHDQR